LVSIPQASDDSRHCTFAAWADLPYALEKCNPNFVTMKF